MLSRVHEIEQQTFTMSLQRSVMLDISNNPAQVIVEGKLNGYLYSYEPTTGVLSISDVKFITLSEWCFEDKNDRDADFTINRDTIKIHTKDSAGVVTSTFNYELPF